MTFKLEPPTPARDALDRYYTPGWATLALLEKHGTITSRLPVLEPCAGGGGIADALESRGLDVERRDVDPRADSRNIVSDFLSKPLDPVWKVAVSRVRMHHWIITNPPYSLPSGAKASDFVKQALGVADAVAMLLRLSWLEPCPDRLDIFRERPPSHIIVLPRIAFQGPGGRGGKTDSVTSAWFVWDWRWSASGMTWVTKTDVARLKGQGDLFE